MPTEIDEITISDDWNAIMQASNWRRTSCAPGRPERAWPQTEIYVDADAPKRRALYLETPDDNEARGYYWRCACDPGTVPDGCEAQLCWDWNRLVYYRADPSSQDGKLVRCSNPEWRWGWSETP